MEDFDEVVSELVLEPAAPQKNKSLSTDDGVAPEIRDLAPIPIPRLPLREVLAGSQTLPLAPLKQRQARSEPRATHQWFGIHGGYYSHYRGPQFLAVELELQETGERFDSELIARPGNLKRDPPFSALTDQFTNAAWSVTGRVTFSITRNRKTEPSDRDWGRKRTRELAVASVTGWRDPELGTMQLVTKQWEKVDKPFDESSNIAITAVESLDSKSLGGWMNGPVIDRGNLRRPMFVATSNQQKFEGLLERLTGLGPEGLTDQIYQQRRQAKRQGEVERRREAISQKESTLRKNYLEAKSAYAMKARAYRKAGRDPSALGDPPNEPPSLPRILGTPDEVAKLLDWVAMIDDRIEKDVSRTIGLHSDFGISAFMPANFKPYFGRSVDQMTDGELDLIKVIVGEMSQGKHGGEADQGLDPAKTFFSALHTPNNIWATIPQVWATSVGESWIRETDQWLSQRPTYPDAVDDLKKLSVWWEAISHARFESERESVRDALATHQSTAARDLIAAMLDGSVPYQSEKAAEFFESIQQTEREAYRAAVNAMAGDQTLGRLKEEFAGITGSTVDRSALKRLRSFRGKLADASDRIRNSESWKMMNEFATKQHERVLILLEPELIAELQANNNDSAIQDAKRNLASDDAAMTPTEQRIAAAATTAESRVQREEALSYFSPQERQWIAPGETVVRIPRVVPEPTAESIRHALLREFATLPGFERTAPNTVVGNHAIARSRSRLTRKADKMIYDFSSTRLTVNQAWRWKDRNGKTSKVLDEGFESPFSHDGVIRPNRKLDDSDWRILGLMGINPQRQQQHFKDTPTWHTFVLTEEGYRSPTLRRFFAGQNAKQWGTIQAFGVAADIKANELQKAEP